MANPDPNHAHLRDRDADRHGRLQAGVPEVQGRGEDEQLQDRPFETHGGVEVRPEAPSQDARQQRHKGRKVLQGDELERLPEPPLRRVREYPEEPDGREVDEQDPRRGQAGHLPGQPEPDDSTQEYDEARQHAPELRDVSRVQVVRLAGVLEGHPRARPRAPVAPSRLADGHGVPDGRGAEELVAERIRFHLRAVPPARVVPPVAPRVVRVWLVVVVVDVDVGRRQPVRRAAGIRHDVSPSPTRSANPARWPNQPAKSINWSAGLLVPMEMR
mmetsp:Transcript_3246/g.7592  ORF Transcript_3246/g.7592 Transcript_3246/m.7592 type:complete len:272 (+) Transcript_3246:502-1317(+)